MLIRRAGGEFYAVFEEEEMRAGYRTPLLMNETAYQIYQGIQQHTCLEEITRGLSRRYGIPAAALQEDVAAVYGQIVSELEA